MSSEPVDPSKKNNEQDAGNETRVLNIGALHYHPTEIDSLNRLAQTDPELARIVVQQKEGFDRREHGSFRFGMIAASSLAISILIALSYIVTNLGVGQSLIVICGALVSALLIRVILTGEWSETSWMGHVVKGIITALGGVQKD